MSNTHTQPVVFVTGASSGIGLALVRQLLQADGRYRIAATARESSLPRLADAGLQESDNLRLVALDVTEPDYAALQSIQSNAAGAESTSS